MSIPRVLSAIGLVLIAALAAAVLFLQYADLNRYRPDIETLVSDAVGRDFKINGDLQLDLLPAPALLIEQLSLANAPWSSEPLMVEVGHASVRVNLWSLLSGPIQVKEFRLHDVLVLMESNAEGESNFDFGGGETEATDSSALEDVDGQVSLPLVVDLMEISNIRLIQRQPETEDQVIHLEELSLRPNDASNLDLSGKAEILKQQLILNGEIGPREQLKALGAANFALTASLGSINLQADGTVADLADLTGDLSGTKLKAVLSTDEVADIIEQAGLSLPFSGPLQLAADITQTGRGAQVKLDAGVNNISTEAELELRGQRLTIDARVSPLDRLGALFDVADLPAETLALQGDITLTGDAIELKEVIAQLASAELRASGTLATGDGTSELELQVKGSSMAELMTSLPTIPFDGNIALSLSSTELSLDPLQLNFGDSDLAGAVNIVMEKGTVIDARLKSKRLDLVPFEPEPPPPSDPATPVATETEAEPADADKPNRDYVFVDEPIDFDALQQFDVDVELAIGQLLSREVELERVKLDAGLHGGDLKAQLDFATSHGGTAANTLSLTTSTPLPQLEALIKLRDLRVNVASGEVDHIKQIPPVSITVELASKGTSPHTLASRSNGYILITQGSGRVENSVLNSISGDILSQLFSALNPMAKEDKYSNWDCSVIRLDITDGFSEFSRVLLQGEKIMIVGGGDIDLNTEKLNIEFNTKPREGIGISADMFVTPFVALKGTLASPRLGLNEKGVLISGGAAVATMGISLLVQGAADRAAGAMDHCEKALAEFGQHPPIDGS